MNTCPACKSLPQSGGFTLVEMIIATTIMVVAISLAMTGYLYIWSESSRSNLQDELDVEVQLSAEKIKRDLRLSALEKIYYFPATASRYTAISMPLARDDDGDGAVDIDGSGKIIWDKTVIYHVWSGNPNQLRKTTIDPRDNTLVATQLQAQLTSVATVGNGSATYGSSNCSTEVVFENLFDWYVEPQGASFDGYSAVTERAIGVVLGSAVLSNGNHTLQFSITNKNPLSSSYKMGIDTLFMSPSVSEREAEAQLPATAVVGATIPTNVYVSSGSWSGNYHLSFPSTAIGRSFTLTMRNDCWEETNFRATGELHRDTTVLFDTSLTPNDFVVLLDGNTTNWSASLQTADSTGGQTNLDNYNACAVRVLLRGNDLTEGNWILTSGGRCQVNFRAGSLGSLIIDDAFIAEADSTNTQDAIAGTMTRLRFSGGESLTLGAGTHGWSDMTTFPINKDKSYLVSFLVNNVALKGNAWRWEETNTTGYVGAYVIPATNAPAEADAMAYTWSTRTDVYTTNVIPAVQYLFTTYPTNGVYVSTIFDTHNSAPVYSNMFWNSVLPSGASLSLKVRSGNSNDMSDASNWTNISALASSGTGILITPGAKRYLQYQSTLLPTAAGTGTPKLRDTRILWRGDTMAVDIGGTFSMGPDYGIFSLLVDGQPLKKGVVVNVEIFDYARAHGATNRITSMATTEVTPRNSGR